MAERRLDGVGTLAYSTPPAGGRGRRNRLVVLLLAGAGGLMLMAVLLGGVYFTLGSKRSGPAPARFPPGPKVTIPAEGPGGATVVGPAESEGVSGFAEGLGEGQDSDAEYQAARAAVTKLLDDLVAGRRDGDAGLAGVAARVKGYRAWSVTSQRKAENVPAAWTFGGRFTGEAGAAEFGVMMVRQGGPGARWAVGSFRGPDRE